MSYIKHIKISTILLSTACCVGNTALADARYTNLDDIFISQPSIREYVYTQKPSLVKVSYDYTRLPNKISALGERAFIFSPKLLRWAAYDKYGYKVAGGIANGGANFCAELNEPCRTPVGSFRITRQGDVECESSQFPIGEGGAPMPYCSFFKDGNAIHGSPYVSRHNTSHGCIRVLTPAAKWLSNYFLKKSTRVITLPY